MKCTIIKGMSQKDIIKMICLLYGDRMWELLPSGELVEYSTSEGAVCIEPLHNKPPELIDESLNVIY